MKLWVIFVGLFCMGGLTAMERKSGSGRGSLLGRRKISKEEEKKKVVRSSQDSFDFAEAPMSPREQRMGQEIADIYTFVKGKVDRLRTSNKNLFQEIAESGEEPEDRVINPNDTTGLLKRLIEEYIQLQKRVFDSESRHKNADSRIDSLVKALTETSETLAKQTAAIHSLVHRIEKIEHEKAEQKETIERLRIHNNEIGKKWVHLQNVVQGLNEKDQVKEFEVLLRCLNKELPRFKSIHESHTPSEDSAEISEERVEQRAYKLKEELHEEEKSETGQDSPVVLKVSKVLYTSSENHE